VHRQAGVDDRVHEHDVTAFDLDVQVLEEANAVVVLAVTGELDEVEVVVDVDRAREVAEKWDARLERADEQRFAPFVVARELGADLTDPSADLVGVEEDLADPFVELGQRAQDAFRSP
jgi:hypothetical protein